MHAFRWGCVLLFWFVSVDCVCVVFGCLFASFFLLYVSLLLFVAPASFLVCRFGMLCFVCCCFGFVYVLLSAVADLVCVPFVLF